VDGFTRCRGPLGDRFEKFLARAATPFTGLSADYVHRETKRAREGLARTKTLLWPGIDIDIPTQEGNSRCSPEGVRDATLAALQSGTDGVILSRKCSEMKLAKRGAGMAVRQAQKA
jgi:hypothetical protein